MTLDIKLPELPGGAATVLRWLVSDGEAVAQGAPLALVLTERAEVLLPAPAAGTLVELVPVGAQVELGDRLGRLEPRNAEGGEAAAGHSSRAGSAEKEKQERGTAAARAPLQKRFSTTPLARAIANDHGVELEALAGSGVGGRVMARDVHAWITALARTPHANAEPSTEAGVARGDAPLPTPHSRLSTPHSQLPIVTATLEFDASAALAAVGSQRAAFARLGLPLGLTACVVAAAAALLPDHPLLNAGWREEGIALRRRLHIAVAEAGGEGAPLCWKLVRDAGDLTLRGVARALALAGEPEGATFAVVSLAEGWSWHGGAAPLEGTAAALSVGAPVRRAVAVGEAITLRPTAALTLGYDARVLDHSTAVAFLVGLRASLERA